VTTPALFDRPGTPGGPEMLPLDVGRMTFEGVAGRGPPRGAVGWPPCLRRPPGGQAEAL